MATFLGAVRKKKIDTSAAEWCFPFEDMSYGYEADGGTTVVTEKDLKRLAMNNMRGGNKADWHQDWPLRFQTDMEYGDCTMCAQPLFMWMTTTAEWSKLPPDLRGFHICVDCYRFVCWRVGHAPAGYQADRHHITVIATRLLSISHLRAQKFLAWAKVTGY